MAKATINKLNNLHDRMAQYFESLLDKEERLQPGELSAILKFLKDNEITTDLVESTPMQSLITRFAMLEDEIA
jgi:hypothetical protein